VIDFDRAVSLLVTGERSEVRSFLIELTDQERKTLGPKFRRWLTHGNTTRVPRDREALAVVATAGGVRQALVIASHGWGLTNEYIEDAVRILGKRSPPWMPEFVDGLLDEGSHWSWRLARGLVRADLVPTPGHPEYYRGTVRGVPDFNMKDRRPLVQQLEKDPGLIGEHLIGMLATEGTGRLLTFHDNFQESEPDYLPDAKAFPEGTWRDALLALIADGRMDRQQLLDVILAAPLRDWAMTDLVWYAGMHEAIGPTTVEVISRQTTYTRLLTVEHGPSVKLAQSAILRVIDDERFQPIPVLDVSRATLARSDKTAVSAQLRLLEKIHKVHPGLPFAETVRVASDHPRPDIREQAAKFLRQLGDTAPAAEAQAPFTVPTPEPHPVAPAIEPIGSADELSELLLALIEEVDAVQMERAIDGLLRLADERPRTSGLLLQRAMQCEYYADDPRVAPIVLSQAWLTPRSRFRDGEWPIVLGHTIFPAEAASPETFVGALGRRLTGVAQALRGGHCASLALPTRTDGSLDVETLNRRLSSASRRREPPEAELALALLRVAPAERHGVEIPGWLRKSRTADRVMSSPAHSWERHVVAYKRMNWEPVRRVPVFRNSAAREGDALDGILSRRQPERTAGVEANYGEYEGAFERTLAMGALLLPHDLDVLAAHAHPYLDRDLRKDRATTTPILDAIARARTPNREPESSALVLGLAAKDARARTAAQDALLDLARYGLLDGSCLGRQAALHLKDDIVVGQRVSSGLVEVARGSDAAVLPVLDALQELVAVVPGRKDAGVFMELTADLSERASRPIKLPEEFRTLAATKSSSLLAKAARRLV
jgi:hypothetical protein